MNIEPKSRLIDSNYTESMLILTGRQAMHEPVRGTVLHDSSATGGITRDYGKVVANFEPIRMFRISNPLLTDLFVIHKQSFLYLDSSILLAIGGVRVIPDVLRSFSNRIENSSSDVMSCYEHETALVMHNEGGVTWGHFLLQNFPKVLVYLGLRPCGKIVVPREFADDKSNFSLMFNLFGIPKDQLIPVDRRRTYKFRELVLLDFMWDFRTNFAHPASLDMLETAKAKIACAGNGENNFFARRARQNSRVIENIDGVEACLAKYKIPARTLGKESVEDQVRAWKNAGLVVTVSGSDLANIVFGNSSTKILAISPDWVRDNFFYNLAIAKGMQWNELRCGSIAAQAEPKGESSFFVDVELLDSMLEKLIG